MNKIDLLKSLAPGFLPLIVFIGADAIWGTKIGLIVAVVFGLLELGFTYLKEKTLDKFIILDIGLIVVLGIVSIVLENDIFFKLKPALIELIFCAILGISVFSPLNIILLLSRRYMKNIDLPEGQIQQFKRSLKILFVIFLIHTAMIIYSAFSMSKEAWAFISGGLFYLIFAAYFAWEFIRTRLNRKQWLEKYKDEEWFDMVDQDGKVIGRAPRSVCHEGPGRLHPVVHIHVIDGRDRIYLQKRSWSKEIQPGKWDTAVGGHLSSGENLEDGVKREAEEELGMRNFQVQLLEKYVWETEVESELVFMFISRYNGAITINREEIDEGKFWRIKKIKESLGKEIFTPNFEFEFEILLKQVF